MEVVDEFNHKLLPALASDDVDIATIEAIVIAGIRDSAKANGTKLVVALEMLEEIRGWMLNNCRKEDIPKIPIEVQKNRDDRPIEVACLAVCKSFGLVLEQLHQPSAHLYFRAKRTIKSICRRVLIYFDKFCKDHLKADRWDAINLRKNILKAADIAEDYNRSRKVQIQLPEDGHFQNFILHILVRQLRGKSLNDEIASTIQFASQAPDDDHLVGLGVHFIKIKEQLIGGLSNLEIISIVAMGGIGKTTLARKIYEDPEIKSHFHIRAWIEVSHEYCERDVLLGLLQSIASLEKIYEEDQEQLAEQLKRELKGRRYFIVIDDIWATKAWDNMKLCFPDDDKGSRIVLTSRNRNMASHVSPEKPPHLMNFLSLEDSWKLLHKQVYRTEACPPQLVNVGMQIAKKCQGLPLAIKVVSGHLSSISRTKECWEDVAKRIGLHVEGTPIYSLFNILSMSYNDLPHYLKACFLSMVIFPKNTEIHVKKLIALWAAMGFLPPKLPNIVEEVTMEGVAMKCLEDLICRNLIMVKKKNFDGKVKLCGIHDLLWNLSLSQARNEGHLIFGSSPDFDDCDDRNYILGLCRTLLYVDHSFGTDCSLNSVGFKSLRVLDILNQSFDHFPIEITNLVNLRYLSLATFGNIPRLVSKLCNLETLINYCKMATPVLPKEIWSLARMRHLHVGTCTYLAEPPAKAFEGSYVPVLPDLQTLSNLSIVNCTKEIFVQIPNLKELGIHESGVEDTEHELLFSSLSNISYLDQLEILKLCCNSAVDKPRRIPQWDSFLPNIKQLTLIGTHLPWSEMNALAKLRNLEVLKLKENAFKGVEWEMEDEEFLHLRCLLLESLDLVFWKANQDHFPNLQCLVIRDCVDLTGIPAAFEEISTLELIDLEYCNPETIDMARNIQKAQMAFGNEQFTVRIGHSIAQMQLMGLVLAFVYMSLHFEMLWFKTG